MNSAKIKNAFKQIDRTSGSSKNLRQRILSKTVHQKMDFFWLIKTFSIVMAFALITLFVLPDLQVSPAEIKVTSEDIVGQSISHLQSLSEINSVILLILTGTVRIFLKLSFLAFILTAAAMPGQHQNSQTGEIICPD